MAKKFVRGITDIKEINKQDFDTNNVNDLLSDGVHNYIHRKKEDNSEEYHNLTNNLKTITSDNADLLSVTNDNNSTNSATVHPKHDTQKEQIIEPANNTVSIVHGENATNETTKLKVSDELVETINNKQNTLASSTSIGITSNNQLRQLFYYKKTYTHINGLLTTHLKALAQNNNVNVTLAEFNFIIKINKNAESIDFTLNNNDTGFFNSLMTKYGENNTVSINGCVFTLNGSTLTVSTTNNTQQNYVITFSDII